MVGQDFVTVEFDFVETATSLTRYYTFEAFWLDGAFDFARTWKANITSSWIGAPGAFSYQFPATLAALPAFAEFALDTPHSISATGIREEVSSAVIGNGYERTTATKAFEVARMSTLP